MISILSPCYTLKELKLKPKMFHTLNNIDNSVTDCKFDTFNCKDNNNNKNDNNNDNKNDNNNYNNNDNNNDNKNDNDNDNKNDNDNRFIKLLNDKYNKEDNYIKNSNSFNKKFSTQDEYMNFKKRKSYTYNHYINFNNKKNFYKSKHMNDDMIFNKKNEYIYNSEYESINHPEIYVKTEINNIYDNELISKLKSMNININVPIESYGIVLYTYEKNKYLKYFVCQRRDSISYIQYLQDLIDEKNILKYINLMSIEEKNRCLEYYYKQDAHSIWKDLWININSKIYKKDYKRCTDIFLKNMEKYIDYFKNDKIGQKENEWCFPKGRKHSNENEIECALREFEEETNIPIKDICVDKNINFEEVYIGSNNLLYKTIYYVAYIPYIPKKIYKYYPNNIRKKSISPEINDCEWMEYQTAIEHLNESKKQILEKINNYILKRSFKK